MKKNIKAVVGFVFFAAVSLFVSAHLVSAKPADQNGSGRQAEIEKNGADHQGETSPQKGQGMLSDEMATREKIERCMNMEHGRMLRCLMGPVGADAVAVENPATAQMAPQTVPEKFNKEQNPITADENSVESGRAMFRQNCSACHGPNAQGDGYLASYFNKPVANLTSPHAQTQSDGALFWRITNGSTPMPGFEDRFSEKDVWNIINYLRTLSKK